MTDKRIIYQELNKVTLVYTLFDGVYSFTCVPNHLKEKIKPHRLYKDNWTQYFAIDPMVQIARKGDSVNRDFSASETSYNSTTSYELKFVNQEVLDDNSKLLVKTNFQTNDGLFVSHCVSQIKGYEAFEMWIEVTNEGKECSLDRLSSFAITSLSPFLDENDPDKLILHRLQNYWSIEGRKESNPISKFNFEDSWSALGIKVQRIASRGAMPARNYIPFIALEDTITNVTWAVQIEAPDSWEIETIHRYGSVSLTGGHADYLYGHWRKKLATGETFTSRKAYVSVVEGNLECACANITRYHDNLLNVPQIEEDLPVMYNEYLTSWGVPTIDNIKPQLDIAKRFNAKYYVIDAGWFCDVNDHLLGDWEVQTDKFPNGLAEFSQYARSIGYEGCGVWYELEAVTDNSKVVQKEEWLAKLDGKPIQRRNRLFLDFRNEEVLEYLTEKVINNLKKNDLNYIKIDYNENIGYGLDGDDSLGEGLRKHSENVVKFMKRITKEVPNLVLENCSSGGMRHEVTYDTAGSMVSFSDAHEIASGVVIAMDLHRIMQPRTMQIWASILPKLSLDEIYFTMAKAMLGRICLSGRLLEVGEDYLQIVDEGVKFYDNLKAVVKHGNTVLIDTDEVVSIKNPKGIVRLVRKSLDEKIKVCYAFAFAKDERIIDFNEEGYHLTKVFGNASVNELGQITFDRSSTCMVMIYEKD